MPRFARALLAVTVFVTLVGAGVSATEAHERRQVGSYVFNVGFEREPAFLEDLNAAFITVFRADGQPLEGVEKTLTVEVSVGGASRTFDLKPILSRPGAYHAEFFPTKTGAYAFRFVGTVDGQAVNERFESGPGRFDAVVSKAELQFPAAVPANGELAGQARPGQAAAGAPGAGADDTAQRALDRADSARTTARVVGGAGIALGLLGVILAVTRRRSRDHRDDAGVRGEPI